MSISGLHSMGHTHKHMYEYIETIIKFKKGETLKEKMNIKSEEFYKHSKA